LSIRISIMPSTRRISGEIVFPADATAGTASRVQVEVHDVSMLDQPSVVLAKTELQNVSVGPNVRVPFALSSPVAPVGRALSLRVQVNMKPGQTFAAGDYLSTVSIPVASTGDVTGVFARVTKL
jgi:uncharacterized lipoprotein YbaY